MRRHLNRKGKKLAGLAAAGTAAIAGAMAFGADPASTTWIDTTDNSSNNIATTANWNNGNPGALGAIFAGTATSFDQPNISGTTDTTYSLWFQTAGWTLGGAGIITVSTGYPGAVTSQNDLLSQGAGTNTIGANVTIGTGAYRAAVDSGTGNTLVFNGTLTYQGTSRSLGINGGGTVVFNTAASLNTADSTALGSAANLVLNCSNALGTTATQQLQESNNSDITAVGAAQSLANIIEVGGNGGASYGNAIAFNGQAGYTAQNLTINNVINSIGGNNTVTVDGARVSAYGFTDTDTPTDPTHYGTITLNGPASGAATLVLTGNGGASVSNVGATLSIGANLTLLVNGTLTNGYYLNTAQSTWTTTNFTSTTAAGGTLGGSGVIDFAAATGFSTTHTINGTLAPGDQANNVSGTITFGTASGGDATHNPNSTANNLTISATGAYSVFLGGATAGTGFTQTVVYGGISLNPMSTLAGSISSGFAPTLEESFPVMLADGSTAVSGVFSNSTLTLSNTLGRYIFSVNYNDGAAGTSGDVDLVVTSVLGPPPPTKTWGSPAAGGSWNTASNWNPSGVLSLQGAVANFTTTGAGVVTLDANQTVGQINFGSPVSYTVSQGTGGTAVLTIDNTNGAGSPAINVTAGSHSITAPMNLANGITLNVAPITTLALAGAVSGTANVAATGGGAVNLAAGVLPATTNLAITNNTTVSLSSAAVGAQSLASLTVDATSTLNVGKQRVSVPDTGAAGSTYASILGLVDRGYVNKLGNGITTSQTGAYTGVGIYDNGSSTTFGYTLLGDATMAGGVGFNDLLILAQNYGMSGTTWQTGDFNYDGYTGFNDLLDLAYNYQLTANSPQVLESHGISPAFAADWSLAQEEVAAAVPEPASVGLLAIAAFGLGARRRRANVVSPPSGSLHSS